MTGIYITYIYFILCMCVYVCVLYLAVCTYINMQHLRKLVCERGSSVPPCEEHLVLSGRMLSLSTKKNKQTRHQKTTTGSSLWASQWVFSFLFLNPGVNVQASQHGAHICFPHNDDKTHESVPLRSWRTDQPRLKKQLLLVRRAVELVSNQTASHLGSQEHQESFSRNCLTLICVLAPGWRTPAAGFSPHDVS